MLRQVALAAVGFQAAALSRVAGHGNLIVPMPTGDSTSGHEYYFGDPAGEIEALQITGDAAYDDYCSAVDQWFTDNGIATLRDFIITHSPYIGKCGNTLEDGEPQPVPSDGFAQHDTLGESHRGPCEIWCDDTRVFHSPNCLDEFAGQKPAMIPIDVATCQASSEMTFYWLALHAYPWQVYVNCAALSGSAGSQSGVASNTTDAPFDQESSSGVAGEAETETETSSTQTEAPAEATETSAPVEETEAPAVTTAAPLTSKCKARK